MLYSSQFMFTKSINNENLILMKKTYVGKKIKDTCIFFISHKKAGCFNCFNTRKGKTNWGFICLFIIVNECVMVNGYRIFEYQFL